MKTPKTKNTNYHFALDASDDRFTIHIQLFV